MDKTAQAYIAYMGVFIGSITFTIVFPFANEMVMSFGVVSDKDKTGTYVGIMASSLMFSRTISSPFWGYVIDKWGRKKVTQFSLISSLVLCFVFGLSNNFVFAVVIRFLIGALTPITISSRTILGDLFKGREASSGMAGFSIAWGMGSVSGGFLGGILANKAYINTRLGWVFVEYPFLLVNLVPSLMSLVALVLGELYLRDDLVKNEENLIESNSRNMKELLLDTKLLVLLSMSFLLSYNSTGFQELIVLFFWAKRDSGGLEINTQQIGYITGGSA
jgi:MFS family permease